MFKFTDAERAYLSEIRALTQDDQGREVLVGLTLEETVAYVEHGRRRVAGEHAIRDDSGRYLELHEKHERARLDVLGSEIHLRNENPPRH